MISDEVGVVCSTSAGRFPATKKLATRLDIMSAWAGSETEAASAAVRTKSAEWRAGSMTVLRQRLSAAAISTPQARAARRNPYSASATICRPPTQFRQALSSPWKTLRSMRPLTPCDRPEPEYCQNTHLRPG